MSKPLLKNRITLGGRTGSRAIQTVTPQQLIEAQQVTIRESVRTIPEVELLRGIPGSGPFLNVPELIPDLIYILHTDGIRYLFDGYRPPDTKRHEEILQEVLDLYQRGDLEAAVPRITNYFQEMLKDPERVSPQQVLQDLLAGGSRELAALIARADPNNPASIIFQHSSQKSFRDVQKVERELIQNEPDVVERSDIQCACGSSRIRSIPVQLRRADEGSNYLMHCVACHRQWNL